jgi:transcriptional regulator with XRE-family HTH domain
MDWKSIITDLRNAGMTQKEIADEMGGGDSRVSEVLSGRIKSLRYEHGQALVRLHEERCGTKKAA